MGRKREGDAPESSRALPTTRVPMDDINNNKDEDVGRDEDDDDYFDEGELEFDDEDDDLLDDEEGVMSMSNDEVGRRLLEALERMGQEGGAAAGGYLDDDDDDYDGADFFDDNNDDDDEMEMEMGGYIDARERGGGLGRDEVMRMMDEMMAGMDPGGITPDFDYEPGEGHS